MGNYCRHFHILLTFNTFYFLIWACWFGFEDGQNVLVVKFDEVIISNSWSKHFYLAVWAVGFEFFAFMVPHVIKILLMLENLSFTSVALIAQIVDCIHFLLCHLSGMIIKSWIIAEHAVLSAVVSILVSGVNLETLFACHVVALVTYFGIFRIFDNHCANWASCIIQYLINHLWSMWIITRSDDIGWVDYDIFLNF